MWLFTKYGFFSVVQHRDDEKKVLIRARIKDDLVGLLQFMRYRCHVAPPEVVELPHSDYAFRIALDKSVWRDVAAALTGDIDYDNFKNAVHGQPDRDDAYLRVWQEMQALQQRRRQTDGS